MLNGGRAKLPRAPAASCGCDESPPSFGLLEYYRARGMGHVGHPCGCTDRPASMSMETLGGPLAVAMTIPALRSWTRPWERFGGATGSSPVAGPQRRRTSWDPFGKGVGTGTSPPPTRLASTGAGNGNPLLPSRSVGATPFTRRRGRSSGSLRLADYLWDVDIYLSAGEVVGTPGITGYRSCDLDDVGNCKIYHIGWNLRTMRAVFVEEVVAPTPFPYGTKVCPGGLGAIQPALSPDGTRLAWAEACRDASWNTLSQDVRVGDATWSSYPVPNTRNDFREYPEWLDDSTLLFGSAGATGASVWSHPVDGHTVAAVVGPAAGGTGDYQNPRVHPEPDYLGSARQPRMATFGGTADKRPRVTSTTGSGAERFNFGTDATFLECHHPAWNPDGTGVMCTRQEDPLVRETSPSNYDEQPLYQFGYGRFIGAWSNPAEMFTSPTQAALETTMGVDASGATLFPQNPGTGPGRFCQTRVWKYAQWCKSEDYVVATLFCTNTTVGGYFGFGVFTSRVVFIDNRTPTGPVFHDLTSAVEHHLGAAAGSYHGIFATCGTPGCLYSS